MITKVAQKQDYRVVAGFDAAEEFANEFYGYRTFTILVGVHVLNGLHANKDILQGLVLVLYSDIMF